MKSQSLCRLPYLFIRVQTRVNVPARFFGGDVCTLPLEAKKDHEALICN